MSEELVYVDAEEDDVWWRATPNVADVTPVVANATRRVAQTETPPPVLGDGVPRQAIPKPASIRNRSTRVDLVIYLASLSVEEAMNWLERGRPDG